MNKDLDMDIKKNIDKDLNTRFNMIIKISHMGVPIYP